VRGVSAKSKAEAASSLTHSVYTRAVLRIAMRAAAAKRLIPMSVAEGVMLSEPIGVVPAEVPVLTPTTAD
jgi:hypothetical protein